MQMKQCSKCGQEYPASPQYFHRDCRRKSGFKSYCKVCAKKQKLIYLDKEGVVHIIDT